MSEQRPVCGLCGHPMPEGEEMFQYHGFSGPCPIPKPPAQEKAAEAEKPWERFCVCGYSEYDHPNHPQACTRFRLYRVEKWSADASPENARRVYYQNIVYHVCNELDKISGAKPGKGIVCGTADQPTQNVQQAMAALCAEIRKLKEENRILDEISESWAGAVNEMAGETRDPQDDENELSVFPKRWLNHLLNCREKNKE